MDELIEALDRYVRAMIDYSESANSEWGPGSAIAAERDKATEVLEKAIAYWVDMRISVYLMDVLAKVEDKLVDAKK